MRKESAGERLRRTGRKKQCFEEAYKGRSWKRDKKRTGRQQSGKHCEDAGKCERELERAWPKPRERSSTRLDC
jgi:hypothetical protein